MYCNSKDITPVGRRSVIRRYLQYGLGIWFSPNSNRRETITFCECISCAKCGANYLVMNMEEQKVESLIFSLNPQRSALQNYRDIFGSIDFDEWKNNIIAIVKIEANTIHVFFRISRKKAYHVCNIIEGHFTIVSVEEVRK